MWASEKKITNFGVFVELEEELEGLLHISELADHKVETPQEIVEMGQDLEVKILRVDMEDRKIGLSLKRAQWAAEEREEGGDVAGDPVRRRGGLEGDTGMLGSLDPNILETVRREDEAAAEPQRVKRDVDGQDIETGQAEDIAMEALGGDEAEADAVDAEADTPAE